MEPDTLCVTHHQLLLSLSLEIIPFSFPHLLFYPALFPSFISIFPLWALSAFLSSTRTHKQVGSNKSVSADSNVIKWI